MELPIAPDAEKAVVAKVIATGGQALEEIPFLKPEHFYTQSAKLVFEQALGIYQGGGKPDYIVLIEILRDNGVPAPRDVLTEFQSVPLDGSVEEAARIVYGKWLARQIIDFGQEVSSRAFEEQPEALLDEIERRAVELRPSGVGDGFSKISLLSDPGVRTSATVVSTGFGSFDSYLGGLASGRLVTIASRPGVGKTTLGLNFAANAARAGKSAAIYSLEMSTEELTERLLVNEARLEAARLKGKVLTIDDVDKIANAAWAIDQWRLFIDDSAALSVFEIGARAKKLAHSEGLDLLIVDYLQLIDPPEADSRVQEIAEITRYLKRLSRELRVPVVALSQFSRAAEMREGRPRMSDLRESGSIENDSDQIIALWRNDEDWQDERVCRTRIDILKNRHGPIGDFALDFVKSQSRFEVP